MKRTIVAGTVLAITAFAAPTNGDVIISEIMYNPESNEQPPARTEWIELYNTGEEAVDLTGWYVQDEDGQTTAFLEGTTIEPKQAVVVIPIQATAAEFQTAWGDTVVVIEVDGWGRPGISGLANSPDAKNEQLSLVRSDGTVADTVNYDDEGAWPSDEIDGASIYLIAGGLDAASNDDGVNWRSSEAGVDGALVCDPTQVYDGADIGSPGVVATESVTVVEADESVEVEQPADADEPNEPAEADEPNEPADAGY